MMAEIKAAPAAEKALSSKLKLTSATALGFWVVESSWAVFNMLSAFPSKSTLVAEAALIHEGNPCLELTISLSFLQPIKFSSKEIKRNVKWRVRTEKFKLNKLLEDFRLFSYKSFFQGFPSFISIIKITERGRFLHAEGKTVEEAKQCDSWRGIKGAKRLSVT